jgi:hypothetical protein
MATIKQRYAPDIKTYKYLIHPLKENLEITEGFLYSQEERDIHGFYFHKGIDYPCSWATPVYAAASGYAVAGYHRFTRLNEDKTPKLFNNKPFSLGLGYFIQIYHPEKVSGIPGGRITQYGHLSKFAKGIHAKTHRPLKVNYEEEIIRKNSKRRGFRKNKSQLEKSIEETKKLTKKYPWVKRLYGFSMSDDIRKKESYLYSPKELKQLVSKGNRFVKWVEQGDIIGYSGVSGLIHGKLRYRENRRRPKVRKYDIWDETHLHFEEASRNWETGKKIENRDPYDIYLSKDRYRNFPFNTLFTDFEKKIPL